MLPERGQVGPRDSAGSNRCSGFGCHKGSMGLLFVLAFVCGVCVMDFSLQYSNFTAPQDELVLVRIYVCKRATVDLAKVEISSYENKQFICKIMMMAPVSSCSDVPLAVRTVSKTAKNYQ